MIDRYLGYDDQDMNDSVQIATIRDRIDSYISPTNRFDWMYSSKPILCHLAAPIP